MKVLTYNIHKGFDRFGLRYILREIKEAVHQVSADLVFLQEVMGQDPGRHRHVQESQFEFLADRIWNYQAYGKNSVTQLRSENPSDSSKNHKHHGNAILSKYEFLNYVNTDISTNRLEKRGILQAKIENPFGDGDPVYVFNVHLNLFEKSRLQQSALIAQKIRETCQESDRIILAGDFNDWRHSLTEVFARDLGLKEVHAHSAGKPAKSFPSFYPLIPLDRIYYRNLKLIKATSLDGNPWSNLSDHIPLLAEFAPKAR